MKAKVEQYLVTKLPDIPPEIKDYVSEVLCDKTSDFSSSDAVQDAVGELISSCGEDLSEEDLQEICTKLANLLGVSNGVATAGKQKILAGPVNLNSMVTTSEPGDDFSSIWTAKRDNGTVVNKGKLEKAEAKIREKQEKKSMKGVTPTARRQDVEATASQSSSKRDNKVEQSGQGNSMDLRIDNVDVSFGDKNLLKNASITLPYGRRYGLVGRNGIGKTTLFKMISSGLLNIPSCIRLLHVAQEVEGNDTTVLESVLEVDTKRHNLLEEQKKLQEEISRGAESDEVQDRVQEIYNELEEIEADKAPAKAAKILFGLGFSADDQRRPTKEFSGGWRMRLALARGLFIKPDLLMLDEPTNMLDMKAIYWLENHLQTWESTLFIVSHDRNFLNCVCTDVVHMHSKRLDSYRGNYDQFAKTMGEKLRQQQKEYEAQMQLRAHTQEFIDKFRYNAKRASLAQSKIKFLERLPVLEPVIEEAQVNLKFPDCETLGPPVLQLDEMCFKYPGGTKNLFHKVNTGADTESRICVVGENGAGKTTLLKLLMGDLEPTGGMRKAHRQLKFGYFAQHHVDQLAMDICPLELIAQRFPGSNQEQYRQALGRFGVSGDLALQSIATLSGGQKSRLSFALLGMLKPNFLIMDEPTNHLDVETVEALGKALVEFKGGVLLVSHDERLIEIVCKELWLVREGTISRLEGGLPEYRKLIQKELESIL